MYLFDKGNVFYTWQDIRKGFRKIRLSQESLWITPSGIESENNNERLDFQDSDFFLNNIMPWFRIHSEDVFKIMFKTFSVDKDKFERAVVDKSYAVIVFGMVIYKNIEFSEGHATEEIITATEIFINFYKIRLFERFARADSEIRKIVNTHNEFINQITAYNRKPLFYGVERSDIVKKLNQLFTLSKDYARDNERNFVKSNLNDDVLNSIFGLIAMQENVVTTLSNLIKQYEKANEERDRFKWDQKAFEATFSYLSSKDNQELSPSGKSKWGDYLKKFDSEYPNRVPRFKLHFYSEYFFKQDEHSVTIVDTFNLKFHELNQLDKANYSLAMFKNQIKVDNRSVTIPYCMHTYDMRIWDNLGYVIQVDFVKAEVEQELAIWEMFTILYFHYNLQLGVHRNYVGIKTMQMFLDAGGSLPHYTNPYPITSWNDIFKDDKINLWLK